MTTAYPSALDSLSNPASVDKLNSPGHATQHININDAVEAIQAWVGIVNTVNPVSLEYRLVHIDGGGA